jgi:hypothetical protein
VILLWLKNQEQEQEQEQKLVGSGFCRMAALGGGLVCLLHELSPNQPHVQLVLCVATSITIIVFSWVDFLCQPHCIRFE